MIHSEEALSTKDALYDYGTQAEGDGRTAEAALMLAAVAICAQLADLTSAIIGHANATGRP